MNKLLKNLVNSLKHDPAVPKKDIPIVMDLLKNVDIEKKKYIIIGIYQNSSYVVEKKLYSYREIPYYVWYNMTYRKTRFLALDGELLNYNLEEETLEYLNEVLDNAIKEKNIKFE